MCGPQAARINPYLYGDALFLLRVARCFIKSSVNGRYWVVSARPTSEFPVTLNDEQLRPADC
jgi:hypothetical protein